MIENCLDYFGKTNILIESGKLSPMDECTSIYNLLHMMNNNISNGFIIGKSCFVLTITCNRKRYFSLTNYRITDDISSAQLHFIIAMQERKVNNLRKYVTNELLKSIFDKIEDYTSRNFYSDDIKANNFNFDESRDLYIHTIKQNKDVIKHIDDHIEKFSDTEKMCIKTLETELNIVMVWTDIETIIRLFFNDTNITLDGPLFYNNRFNYITHIIITDDIKKINFNMRKNANIINL